MLGYGMFLTVAGLAATFCTMALLFIFDRDGMVPITPWHLYLLYTSLGMASAGSFLSAIGMMTR